MDAHDQTTASTPKRERLASHILTRMGLLLLLVGTCFFLFSSHLLQQRFDSFEIEQYTNELRRVEILINQDQQGLLTTAADYGFWTATYQFIASHYPDYIKDNYSTNSLKNVRVDGMVITNIKGRPLVALGSNSNELYKLPIEMVKQLLPLIPTTHKPNSHFQETHLIWNNNEPVLVAVSEVTDTERKFPANGYMLLFRRIDKAYLDHLRELAGVVFLLRQPTNQIYAAANITYQDNNWEAQRTIGKLGANIVISGSSRLLKERYISNLVLAANTLILVILALFGAYTIVHRRVLERLSIFSSLADQHRNDPNADIRWPVIGHDELDNLARSLNHFTRDMQHQNNNLLYLVNHDTLTSLGNRRHLLKRLSELEKKPEAPNFLLLIDLDNFKLINDGLGHAAGDEVLKELANRILAMRGFDTAVRLGGDEFAILLSSSTREKVLHYASRLEAKLDEPIIIHARHLNITASIGIAQFHNNLRAEDLLRNADLAMYEAKRLGKKRINIYEDTLLKSAGRRLYLEQALRSALNAEALEVWFQPIINHESNTVASMEALVRWRIKDEYIRPDEFINIAETTGMIVQLGNFVLDRACATLKVLRSEYPDLSCNVNLSIRQFMDSDLAQIVSARLQEYDLPPECLHLELTESMVAEHEYVILPTMKALVSLGLHFHLDDFGTGYSSLKRLRELPIDTLKIDRSFVTPIQSGDEVMARMIIHMGRELNMAIIAEGVETQLECDRLLAMGCHQIQGYLYARPMPFEQLSVWLAEHAAEKALTLPDQQLVILSDATLSTQGPSQRPQH